MTTWPGADVVRGRFPDRYRISEAEPDGRHHVEDNGSTRRWALGTMELLVARQFDGMKTYSDIARAVREQSGHRIGPEKLVAFEVRLVKLGLLEYDGQVEANKSKPGVLFLWLRRFAVIEIFSIDPKCMLDAFDRYVRWLRSGPAVMAMLAFTVTILTVVATRMAELAHEVPTAIRGLGLGYLCAVCVGCAFLHEGGHAIACRNYRVVVESIGIGVCSLMPFAWTRPGSGRLESIAAAGPSCNDLGGRIWESRLRGVRRRGLAASTRRRATQVGGTLRHSLWNTGLRPHAVADLRW